MNKPLLKYDDFEIQTISKLWQHYKNKYKGNRKDFYIWIKELINILP